MPLSVLGCAALFTGCLGVHLGTGIDDPADPGFLDLSRGCHAISPGFGYRVRGSAFFGNRRLVFFHVTGEGDREILGATDVDGWSTSINEREAVYAISDDGRTLLYLHTLPERGPRGKAAGLYRYVLDEGDEILREGAAVVSWWIPPSLSVPRDTMVFLPSSRPDIRGVFPWLWSDAPCSAQVRRTDGEETPLLVWSGNALHRAVFAGDAPAIRAEIARGEDLEARATFGMTPLNLAVWLGHADAVQELVESGANTARALQMAMFRPEERVIEVLIDGGADVNANDPAGFAPLHMAVTMLSFEGLWQSMDQEHAFNSSARIEMLLAAGADPDIRDSEGNTALHRVVTLEEEELVELLLEHGADVNARGDGGARPLHCAGTTEIARLLLEHGARADVPDDEGRLPWILQALEREKEETTRRVP